MVNQIFDFLLENLALVLKNYCLWNIFRNISEMCPQFVGKNYIN